MSCHAQPSFKYALCAPPDSPDQSNATRQCSVSRMCKCEIYMVFSIIIIRLSSRASNGFFVSFANHPCIHACMRVIHRVRARVPKTEKTVPPRLCANHKEMHSLLSIECRHRRYSNLDDHWPFFSLPILHSNRIRTHFPRPISGHMSVSNRYVCGLARPNGRLNERKIGAHVVVITLWYVISFFFSSLSVLHVFRIWQLAVKSERAMCFQCMYQSEEDFNGNIFFFGFSRCE